MRKGSTWTADEEAELIRRYKTEDIVSIAHEMGRTASSIQNRLTYLRRKLGKEVVPKNRGGRPRVRNKNIEEPSECPLCGSKDINEVITYVEPNVVKAFYCTKCLMEFRADGMILPPFGAIKEG